MNKYIKMSIATMLVMYIANWISNQNPTARRYLKGGVSSGAGEAGVNSSNVIQI